jgi:catabolite regulation protein CreA
MNYLNIDDVKRIAESKGSHFFKPDTMRFFKSRVSDEVYQAANSTLLYFVTSERGPDMPRRFSVRRFDIETGSINTVGEHNSYTRYKAHSLAKALSTGKVVL